MHDTGERQVGGEVVEQRGERVPVGDVAGGDAHADAGGGQLVPQCGRAGRVEAAPARQQQVLRARGGQIAGHVTAERAGATGDEHGPGDLRRFAVVAQWHQPPAEHTFGADGDLVLGLVTAAREHAGELAAQPVVELGGQVGEAAPAPRVLHGRDPAEAPHTALGGAGHGVVLAHGHGAAGHAPQGGVDRRVSQCLEEHHGHRQSHGNTSEVTGIRVGHGQQRHHPGEPRAVRGEPADLLGEVLAGLFADLQPHDVPAQRGHHRVRPGVARGHGRQPGAGQRARRGGDRAPVEPVPPAVHGGPFAAGAAPVAQRGQQRTQRLAVDVQRGRQCVDVGTLDRRPELGVHRVGAARERGGLGPVVLALERVGGQADPASGTEVPGDVAAAHEQFGGGDEEAGEVTLVAAQRAHDGRGHVRLVDGLAEAHGEHGVRRALDEEPVPLAEQRPHGRLEQHGQAQVAVPVAGVEPGAVLPLPGHGRVERHARPPRLDVRERGVQLVADQLHLGRVRGVVHGDPPHPRIQCGQTVAQLVDRGRLAGHDDGGGPVDGRDRETLVEEGFDRVGRERDRSHGAPPGEGGRDGPAAQCHHACTVLEGQCTRHDGGGDLALRVAHDRVGPDAVRLPQRGQRHHHRERHRLHHVDPVQLGTVAQHVRQRPVDEGRQRRGALGQTLREHRRLVQEPGAHARPLGALPGKEEHGAAVHVGDPLDDRGRLPAVADGGEPGGEVVAGADDGGAALEPRAAGQRDADVSGTRSVHTGQEAGGLVAQRGFGAGRQDPGHRLVRLVRVFGRRRPGPAR